VLGGLALRSLVLRVWEWRGWMRTARQASSANERRLSAWGSVEMRVVRLGGLMLHDGSG
jgi:hypothetical protein